MRPIFEFAACVCFVFFTATATLSGRAVAAEPSATPNPDEYWPAIRYYQLPNGKISPGDLTHDPQTRKTQENTIRLWQDAILDFEATPCARREGGRAEIRDLAVVTVQIQRIYPPVWCCPREGGLGLLGYFTLGQRYFFEFHGVGVETDSVPARALTRSKAGVEYSLVRPRVDVKSMPIPDSFWFPLFDGQAGVDLKGSTLQPVALPSGHTSLAFVNLEKKRAVVWRGAEASALQSAPGNGSASPTSGTLDLAASGYAVTEATPSVQFRVDGSGNVRFGSYDAEAKTFSQWKGIWLTGEADAPAARVARATAVAADAAAVVEVPIPDAFWAALLDRP